MRLLYMYFISLYFCENIIFSYQHVNEKHEHSNRIDAERFQSKKHRRHRSYRRDEPRVQIDLASFIQTPDSDDNNQLDYDQTSQEKSDFNENNEIMKLIDKFLKKNSAIRDEATNVEAENSIANVDNANKNYKIEDEMKRKSVDNNYFNKLKMRQVPERKMKMKFPFTTFKNKNRSKKNRNKRLFGFNFNKKPDCGTTKTYSTNSIASTRNPCTATRIPYDSFVTSKAMKIPKMACKLKRSYIERLCPSCGRKFLVANFKNNIKIEQNYGSQSKAIGNNDIGNIESNK